MPSPLKTIFFPALQIRKTPYRSRHRIESLDAIVVSANPGPGSLSISQSNAMSDYSVIIMQVTMAHIY